MVSIPLQSGILLLRLFNRPLNFLLRPSMEQFPRVRQISRLRQAIVHRLDMQDGHIELVNILPLLIPRVHNILLDVLEGSTFPELKYGVFRGVA